MGWHGAYDQNPVVRVNKQTTEGLRFVSGSRFMATAKNSSIKDLPFTCTIGLTVSLSPQGDKFYTLDLAVISAKLSYLKVLKDSPLLIKLNNDQVIKLYANNDYEDNLGESSVYMSTVVTTYTIVPSYGIDAEDIDLFKDGIKKIRFELNAEICDVEFNKYKKDELGNFLYLEKDTFPTEEEQFAAYKQVAETMAGKKVIIRTLDIGADKQVDYFNLDKEDNPAMGYRAIRICLTRPEIFKTQLRALFRASNYGNIAIMYPMIISVDEVRKIKAISEEVKEELTKEGIPFGNVEQGIMIETPAAAVMSDELAKEVDFFSIGTNDLTQYTLAIDRQNQKLDTFYDPHHPAVLAMIKMAADNAHAEGKWIGICGELGADLELTEEFLKMGLDELSVSPALVLPLRKRIRECE